MTEIIDLLNSLASEIKVIKTFLLSNMNSPSIQNEWMDGQDVMQYLHISKRTLQTLRTTNVLPYSQINGKFYYKSTDVQELLKSNYSKPQSKNK